MEKLEITAEKVLKAAKENPESLNTLKSLFPEAFEDNKPFCRIGIILKRISYPKNYYALFKWNGEVRLLNVTVNEFWKINTFSPLKVSKLKDAFEETVTTTEFKSLIGNVDIKDFIKL